jgi:hypothetical protein
MIVVRTRDSRVFEEAYFVMRRDADRAGAKEQEDDELDILWEANRILESSLAKTKGCAIPAPQALPPRQRISGRLLWFASGLVSGGGLVGLLWFLL